MLAVQGLIAAADDVRGVSIAAVPAIGTLLVATATVWIPARRLKHGGPASLQPIVRPLSPVECLRQVKAMSKAWLLRLENVDPGDSLDALTGERLIASRKVPDPIVNPIFPEAGKRLRNEVEDTLHSCIA